VSDVSDATKRLNVSPTTPCKVYKRELTHKCAGRVRRDRIIVGRGFCLPSSQDAQGKAPPKPFVVIAREFDSSNGTSSSAGSPNCPGASAVRTKVTLKTNRNSGQRVVLDGGGVR